METIYHVSSEQVKDYKIEWAGEKFNKPKSVVEFLTKFIGKKTKEYFVVLHLNTKNCVNAVSTISIGSLNASIVHPREVFLEAIKASSASIIVAHNHPSSNPTPSKEDDAVTERLVECGKLLGIKVLDHIIVSDNSGEYFSYKEEELL